MHTKTNRLSGRESSARADARWSVEQRLEFVEERLYWLGEINRQDLIARFGISMSQASADINRYLKLAGDGIRYDKSAKRYVADADFEPVLAEPDAARMLADMRLVDAGLIAPEQARLGVVPPLETTPVPERPVDPGVLRVLWRAIARSLQVKMHYQSMNRAEPVARTVEPHALAHDGFRWHVRAWDDANAGFRDFVLGRITAPELAGPAEKTAEADQDWNTWIDLQITPHPELAHAQRRAVCLDYGIAGDHAVVKVRRALLFYALRRLGLDTPPDARNPQEQHIVLLNRDEILASLGSREAD